MCEAHEVCAGGGASRGSKARRAEVMGSGAVCVFRGGLTGYCVPEVRELCQV